MYSSVSWLSDSVLPQRLSDSVRRAQKLVGMAPERVMGV
jgi:hypothetical protein